MPVIYLTGRTFEAMQSFGNSWPHTVERDNVQIKKAESIDPTTRFRQLSNVTDPRQAIFMEEQIKLNLGSGKNPQSGYINVDKFGQPDLILDLELFPWPWEDSSVSEVLLNHTLEHLGQNTDTFLRIVKELYRICKSQTLIHIAVPHPRHDDFINDPTHVRIITPDTIDLFSQKKNREWIEEGYANTPLGLYLDVDFELQRVNRVLDPAWGDKLDRREISEAQLNEDSKRYNNVIKEYRMIVKVIK